MSALEQARAFAAMAACGALSAAAYDAAALLRRCLGAGKAGAWGLDLLFGAGLSAAVTITALGLGIEPFRLYVLLGVASGIALWFGTAGAGIRALLAFAGKRRQLSNKVQISAEKCPCEAGNRLSEQN